MVYLKYNNVKLPILDSYNITKSSQEIVFSDLQCDFTGHQKADLPDRYQEVVVVEEQNDMPKILFFGYIYDYTFGEMREKDVDIEIDFTLLSPQKIATVRTCTAVGTYELTDLINTILIPLINDGFVLKEMDLSNRQLTVNFLVETVEYCLNNLSNKFNFWWYIDEQKNIYIKDIASLLNKKADIIYDSKNRPTGLEYIKPIAKSDDYANVINFKNVRIYEYSRLAMNESNITESHNQLIDKQITSMKQNEQIDFNFPIDIKKENIIKSAKSNGMPSDYYFFGIYVSGKYSDNTTFTFYIRYNESNNSYEISDNLDFDGNTSSSKEFLLIRDSFFSNLVTGFKHNGSKTISKISEIKSDSVLIWNVNKFYNDKGILAKKGVISKTGIVELTLDMNESWKTIQELIEIGNSYFEKNSLKYADELEVKLDADVFKIGNIFYIDKLILKDKYIVTEVQQKYNNMDFEYIVKCKKANMLSNFIDVFRKENTQTNSDKTYQMYVTHYNEEEFTESHEVVQNEV